MPSSDLEEIPLEAQPSVRGFDDNIDKPKGNKYEDPMYYNYWWKILSRPVTKVKAQAFTRELLAGITVSLAQVPEAVAFSFTAGVPPIIGLQAAWIGGVITALFGGSPGMVTGATGALAVVLPDFVKENGIGYLFVAVVLMGILQFVFGLLRGGKLIKYVGHPIMLGFCNGLAIVIGIAQLHNFKWTRYCLVDCDGDDYDWDQCLEFDGTGNETYPYKCEQYTTGATAGFQVMLVLITMAVIYFLPKFTRKIPSSMAGIIVGTVVEFAIIRPAGFMTPTVEDAASVKGFFPIPVWVDDRYSNMMPSLIEAETYTTCLPISATLAVIGLVESLMTLQLVGQITNKPTNPRAEALAQGSANIIGGAFGGMGSCAMIGQSLINVKSGGITRISTTIAGSFLLLIILVAYPLINLVPLASLGGVMFMVVIGTFEWESLPIIFASILPERIRSSPRLNALRKVKRSDVFIIVLVTVVAVALNLAYAVGAGIVFASLVFVWDQGELIEAVPVEKENLMQPRATSSKRTEDTDSDSMQLDGEDDMDGVNVSKLDPSLVKVYQIRGPLFFASAQRFVKLFDPENDPDIVVLYLDQTILSDYSALVALNEVAAMYRGLGKQFLLRKMSAHAIKAVVKAGHLVYTYDKAKSAEVNLSEILNMGISPSWDSIQHYPKFEDSDTSSEDDTTSKQVSNV